jgi:hypothetical protein
MSENFHRQKDDQEVELSPAELEACRREAERTLETAEKLFGTNNTRSN